MKRFVNKKIFLVILVSILLIVGAVLAVYAAPAYYRKTVGIHIKPSADYGIHDIQYYLQNDPEWRDDHIGNSNRLMGSTGCLVSCVASSITDLGIPTTPKELNRKLTDINGFDGADLIWYKINEVFGEIDYKYTRVFSSSTIEKDIEAGLLPIINVKYMGGGVTHWLIVVGARDGDFLVYDPLNSSLTPMKLSVHGKVYAYRVLF